MFHDMCQEHRICFSPMSEFTEYSKFRRQESFKDNTLPDRTTFFDSSGQGNHNLNFSINFQITSYKYSMYLALYVCMKVI